MTIPTTAPLACKVAKYRPDNAARALVGEIGEEAQDANQDDEPESGPPRAVALDVASSHFIWRAVFPTELAMLKISCRSANFAQEMIGPTGRLMANSTAEVISRSTRWC